MLHYVPIRTNVYRYKVTYMLIPIPIDRLQPHRTSLHHARYAPAMRDPLASGAGRIRSVARLDVVIRAMLWPGGSHAQPQQWRMVSRELPPHVSTLYGVASTRPICCAPYVIPYARARAVSLAVSCGLGVMVLLPLERSDDLLYQFQVRQLIGTCSPTYAHAMRYFADIACRFGFIDEPSTVLYLVTCATERYQVRQALITEALIGQVVSLKDLFRAALDALVTVSLQTLCATVRPPFRLDVFEIGMG